MPAAASESASSSPSAAPFVSLLVRSQRARALHEIGLTDLAITKLLTPAEEGPASSLGLDPLVAQRYIGEVEELERLQAADNNDNNNKNHRLVHLLKHTNTHSW